MSRAVAVAVSESFSIHQYAFEDLVESPLYELPFSTLSERNPNNMDQAVIKILSN